MDKADCSWTPKIKAKERVDNLGLPCGAPYGLAYGHELEQQQI